MINSTALIGLILWRSASFRIPEAATLRRRAGRQHGGGSETFWASCIMLFVLSGKDGQVTGCTEPPPESQMDLHTFSPSPLLHLPSSESRWILSRCLQPSSALWPFLRAALEQIKCPPPFFFFYSTPSLPRSHSFSFHSAHVSFSSFFTCSLCLCFNDLFW